MPLESLLELVGTLQNRIDRHGTALRQSEALTRYTLIDPMLRELGWDTEDPALVMPEYRLGKGYADYALLRNGKPAIMVEAKKLGTPLQDAVSQGIGYCIEDGIPYFAVTDGKKWEIYETHKMAPIAEKLTVQFDIAQSRPITCLKAMALWRPAVEHGSVMAAEAPIVGLEDIPQQIATARVAEESIELQIQVVNDVPRPSPRVHSAPPEKPSPFNQKDEMSADGWIPLSQLYTQKGDKVPSDSQILFPDNTRTKITSWRSIFVETIQWLQDNIKLNASMCPIPVTEERYIIAVEAVHQEGNKFTDPKRIGDLYAEVNYSGPDIVEKARFVIKQVDLDPAQFKVRLP